MASVIYGKCYLWQMYYGKCNYGKNIYGKNIMANETEPFWSLNILEVKKEKMLMNTLPKSHVYASLLFMNDW